MVLLGPDGLIVVEVKHWDRAFLRSHQRIVDDEVDRLERKARRLKGRLDKLVTQPGFVSAKLLLTRELKSLKGISVRGVELYALADASALIEIEQPGVIPDSAIQRLARDLCPSAVQAAAGELRRLGDLLDLKLLSSPKDRFSRVYSARHTRTQDRVTVYLYDLSVPNVPQAEERSQREFELVQRLQKSGWLPSLVEGYQPAPGYPGEMVFFALAESGAQTVSERASDPEWTFEERRNFAVTALRALSELHSPADETDPREGVVHRTLTPQTVRVRASNKPLFTGWRWAKLPLAQTVTANDDPELPPAFTPPEIRRSGLAIADKRSDIYSLCAVLLTLFQQEVPQTADTRAALELGMVEPSDQRVDLIAIADAILPSAGTSKQLEPQVMEPLRASAASWDEGAIVRMGDHDYRIVSLPPASPTRGA